MPNFTDKNDNYRHPSILDVLDDLYINIEFGNRTSGVSDLISGSVGTIFGAVKGVDSDLGNGTVYDFDGVDTYIDFQFIDADVGADNFSIVILLKLVDLDERTFIASKYHNGNQASSNNAIGWDLTYTGAGNGQITFRLNNGDGGASVINNNSIPSNFADGKFHLVVVSVDRVLEQGIMYIDGNNYGVVDDVSGQTGTINSTNSLLFGIIQTKDVKALDGQIALYRQYSKALSQDEVDRLYRFIHRKYGVKVGFNL